MLSALALAPVGRLLAQEMEGTPRHKVSAAQLHRALSERQILASLTTNPARYFKAAKKGRVEKGFDADVVVLDGDPLADVKNLAKVAWTIRAGKVIYQKP